MPLLDSLTVRSGVLALLTAALLNAPVAGPALADTSVDVTAVEDDSVMRGAGKSPEQKVAFTVGVEAEIEDAMNEVIAMLAEAGEDSLRSTCLNDSLAELRRLHASAMTARTNAKQWLALDNIDLLEEEHLSAYIAQADAQQAAATARGCLGGNKAGRSGQTLLRVNVNGTGDGGDNEFGASPDGSTRPGDATPFNG